MIEPSTFTTSSRDALTLFDKMKELRETADEFGVSLHFQIEAAKTLLGKDPGKTYADAGADKKRTLTSHLEKLMMICLKDLGRKEIDYYADAFNRRSEHFTEGLHNHLKSEVERIKTQALEVFGQRSKHSFEEVWSSYHQAVPYIMAAANLMSRHIAFSNIVVSAKNREETLGISASSVNRLLNRAKSELKLDDPRALISTGEIAELERRFREDARKL